MKTQILFLILLVQGSLFAQSKWQKIIDAPEVHSLSIELGFIQNLLVSTGSSDQYVIKTTSEGEYKEVILRLGSGRVNLEYASEESDIRTDSADVFLTVPYGDIHASSIEGKVIGSIPLNTRFHYRLASEKGSIYLNKA